tara:strand:- start:184 stop:312 length:129 start_codon:yes stop_codon:yes gene_type:complete
MFGFATTQLEAKHVVAKIAVAKADFIERLLYILPFLDDFRHE